VIHPIVSVVSRLGEHGLNFDLENSALSSAGSSENHAEFAWLRVSLQMMMDVAAKVVLAPASLFVDDP
jgi:hypothetical protein